VRPLARIVQGPRRPRPPALCECVYCGSRLVNAAETRPLPGGAVWASLRCPDCERWRTGRFALERIRELDRMAAGGRAEIRALHERAVRDNMYRELTSLREALSRDLVGADDFAP